MKRIIDYINENINDLKDQIKTAIDNIDDENFLKKIQKSIKIANADDYNNYKDIITKYLTDKCGIDKKSIVTIFDKIKINHCVDVFKSIVELLSNEDKSKLKKPLTSENLKVDDNIFEIIETFIKDNANDEFEYDEDVENLLKDIAVTTSSIQPIAGEFEFLSRIFLTDLNIKNNSSGNRTKCDINTENYCFEYKVEGGRIKGNKNNAKQKNAKAINDTCKELTLKEASEDKLNDELKKTISDFEYIFQNEKNISSYLEICNELGFEPNKANEIIIKSFISQIPENSIDITDNDIHELIKKCNFNPFGKRNNIKDAVKDITTLWLALNMIFYQSIENFDYMIVFDDNKSGDYISIDFTNDKNNNIVKMWNTINDKHIYCNAKPGYSAGATDNNSAPTIFFKK